MFAVIYQGFLKPGREADYRKSWNTVARYFVEQRGALGSCLHRREDGLWLAYSRWPDQATRDASWPKEREVSVELPSVIRQAILTIKDCIDDDRKLSEICLEVIDDVNFIRN